ncbi:hypothetical protein Lesp01_88840 [Lentzea sp. NBRC 102530]|nr:hypothetical protein Lesp01_88840 [Lentzea sp. NBRC 102530]
MVLVGRSSQISLVAQTVSAVFGKPMRVALRPPRRFPGLPFHLTGSPTDRSPAPATAEPAEREPLVRLNARSLVVVAAAAVLLVAGVLTAVTFRRLFR